MIRVNDRGIDQRRIRPKHLPHSQGTGWDIHKPFFSQLNTDRTRIGVDHRGYPDGVIERPNAPAAFRNYRPTLIPTVRPQFQGFEGQNLLAQQKKTDEETTKAFPGKISAQVDELRRLQENGLATSEEIRDLTRVSQLTLRDLQIRKDKKNAPPPPPPPAQKKKMKT